MTKNHLIKYKCKRNPQNYECFLFRNACRVNKKTGAHYNPRYVGTGGWLASDNEDDDGIGGFGSRLFWF